MRTICLKLYKLAFEQHREISSFHFSIELQKANFIVYQNFTTDLTKPQTEMQLAKPSFSYDGSILSRVEDGSMCRIYAEWHMKPEQPYKDVFLTFWSALLLAERWLIGKPFNS